MPLTGGIDHRFTLMQKPILPIGYRVQAALIHISQLRHMVRLAGEEEALLLFLIEEGVNTGNPQLGIDAQIPDGGGAHPLRRNFGGENDGSLLFIYAQREENIPTDTDGFVQIKVLIVFPVLADGEHAHIAGAVEHGVAPGLVDGGFHLGQFHAGGIFGRRLARLGPLRQNGAEALKGYLVQVFDHGGMLLPPGRALRPDNTV